MASRHIVLAANAAEVRRTLTELFDAPGWPDLPQGLKISAQIVLAEALNNIVEHAYAEQGGEIDLEIATERDGLACVILDRGRPIPDELLQAESPHVALQPELLPEGGFGWFLIRTLARDLGYRRHDNWNRLSFRIEMATNTA